MKKIVTLVTIMSVVPFCLQAQTQYNYISDFNKGLAEVEKDCEWFLHK